MARISKIKRISRALYTTSLLIDIIMQLGVKTIMSRSQQFESTITDRQGAIHTHIHTHSRVTPFLLRPFLRPRFSSVEFWLFENSTIVPSTIYRSIDSFICKHRATVIRKYFSLSFFLSFSLLVSKHVCQFKLVVAPLIRSIFFFLSFAQPAVHFSK